MCDRPQIECERCGGAGWFDDDRPIATPQGPHYGPPIRCTACNGAGETEGDSVLIDMEDLGHGGL